MISNYYFPLLCTFLLLSPVLSIEIIDCETSSELKIETEGSRKVVVYNPEVSISFDRQSLSVYEYPGTDAVDILINDTFVVFTGRMLEKAEVYDAQAKTSWIHPSNVAGSARLTKSRQGHATLSQCDVYIIEKDPETGSNPPIKMQIEILRQAATCLKASLCPKLGKITPDAFSSPLVPSVSVTEQREKSYDTELLQNSGDIFPFMNIVNQLNLNEIARIDGESVFEEDINKMVDSVLEQIKEQVRKEHREAIKLPDVEEKFKFGHFLASNGWFSDISTIRRTASASLVRKGLKWFVTGSFGLATTEINYKSYKLSGIFKVAGSFTAKVTGASAIAAVEVDYTQKPCQANLQSVHVNNIGHVDISFTGLGHFSHLASTIAQMLVHRWQKSLVAEIERTITVIVNDHVKQFDCEKFRPTNYYY